MNGKQTREDRLAEKLRENLRRRKAQARKLATPADQAQESPLPNRGEDG